MPRAIVGLRHMNEVATELMKDVLDAYAQRNAERAREVWERDVDLDALEDSVFRDPLTHMMEDPRNISFCAHLLFCSKNIERIGDHATNIAETVVYLAPLLAGLSLVQAFTIPSSLSSASVKGRFFFWVRCDRLSCGGMVLK